ncbi:MAG: hypothetical protein LAT68_05945 [Cyclobacteriaceae bacterium]|nr:hypothetical protein [Cyclobacteriaceae bacterium]MCH8515854.1 hypothetical protein [Cyclobacteriaceae bacterium]
MTFLNSITTIIATIAPIVIAWFFYSKWRKDNKWLKQHDLASEILLTVYQVEEAFKYIRTNGASDVPEYSEETIRQFKFNEEEFLTLDGKIKSLYHDKRDVFISLRLLELKAKALPHSESLSTQLKTLYSLSLKIYNAPTRYNQIQKQLDRSKTGVHSKYNKQLLQKREYYEDIIYYHSETGDFDQKVSKTINEIEEQLRPLFEEL